MKKYSSELFGKLLLCFNKDLLKAIIKAINVCLLQYFTYCLCPRLKAFSKGRLAIDHIFNGNSVQYHSAN